MASLSVLLVTLPGAILPLGAHAASAPPPTISNFAPSTSSMPSTGGSVTLTATLAASATCTLKAKPTPSSLVAKPACTTAALSTSVTLPSNVSISPVVYSFTLQAKNAAGRSTATTTVTVAAALAPTISGFSASPPGLPSTGGSVRLTATLAAAASCSLKASPAIPNFSGSPECDLGHLSTTVQIPVNITLSPVTYKFKLKSSNDAGKGAATLTVIVAAAVAPTITDFAPSSAELSNAGGSITLTARLAAGALCTLKSSPGLTGLSATPSCTEGLMTTTVVIPANHTTSPITYSFKLKASNDAGRRKATTSLLVDRTIPPTITGFAPSSATMAPGGGHVTLSATVTGDATCVLKASPAIPGLNTSPSCAGGSVDEMVAIPVNTTTSPITYTFKLKAFNVAAQVKAKTTVAQGAYVAPAFGTISATPSALSTAGGDVELTGSVVGDPSCVIKVSPAVAGSPFKPDCGAGTFDQAVTLPLNTTTSPVTYTFKIKASNLVGKAKTTKTVTVDGGLPPTIGSFAASAGTAPAAGGSVTLNGLVSGATTCAMSVKPKIPSLDPSPRCDGGSLSESVSIPLNATTSPISFTFTLTATSIYGSPTSTTVVVQDPNVMPAVTSFTPTSASLGWKGGTVHLEGQVTNTSTCSISVVPNLAGEPWAPACDGGSLDQNIDIPPNLSASGAATYTFTLTATSIVGKTTATTTVTVAAAPLPAVTGFTPTSASLGWNGGSVHLQGQVTNTSTCSITVTPSISGSPWAPTCDAGSLDQTVTIPQNLSPTKAATYTFTLTATSIVGKTTATTTVVVAQKPQPTISSFTAGSAPLSLLGGTVTLTGAVSSADSCQITVTPTIAGAPFTPSCSSGTLSQAVLLPANGGSTNVSYTFTLRASSDAGTSSPSIATVVVPAAFPSLTFLPAQALITPHGFPSSLSCPTPTFCALADLSGSVAVKTGTAWSAPTNVDASPLSAISCASSSFCAAVDSSGAVVTFDGTAWSSPTPVSTHLTAVSCASSTVCLAADKAGSVEWFNGSTWTAPKAVAGYPISSVSCASTTFCMAVDSSGRAYAWAGVGWSAGTIVSTDLLSTISCASSTQCVAGGAPTTTGANLFTWNGSRWTAVTLGTDNVTSISCPTSDVCMAVTDKGASYRLGAGQWSAAQTVEANGWISQVSCPTASACTAVSFSGSTDTWSTTAGSTWVAGSVVDEASGYLVGLSCATSSSCMALSSEGSSFQYSSGTWSAAASTGLSSPTAISCPSSTFCMAVSLDGTAATFDGTTWTATSATPSAPSLDAVSCTSATFCLAVSAGGQFLSFDGTSWGNLMVSGSDIVALNDVSCASKTFCIAVSQNGTAWTWNATTVTSRVIFTARVPGTSVSCASTSLCTVGSRDGRIALWSSAGGWQPATKVFNQPVQGLSCIPGTAACAALDDTGRVATSVGGKAWSTPTPSGLAGDVVAISCTADGFCMIIDGQSATGTGDLASQQPQ